MAGFSQSEVCSSCSQSSCRCPQTSHSFNQPLITTSHEQRTPTQNPFPYQYSYYYPYPYGHNHPQPPPPPLSHYPHTLQTPSSSNLPALPSPLVFQDVTRQVINAQVPSVDTPLPDTPTPSAPIIPQKRKRGGGGGGRGRGGNRRSRMETETPATNEDPSASGSMPATFGVGPIVEDNNSVPRAFAEGTHFNSLLREAKSYDAGRDNGATDVWYFVQPLTSSAKPVTLPENEPITLKHPDKKQYPFLSCRLCKPNEKWQVWSNHDGIHSTARSHLQKHHGTVWMNTVIIKDLKGREKLIREGLGDVTAQPGERPPFTLDGFYERLVKWVAADDHAIYSIENPELRDLLLYTGVQLNEKDLPHRTKLGELIVHHFNIEYKKMIERLKNAAGRISFTSDIWSRQNMQSHVAVTAHYVAYLPDGSLVQRSELVAFRVLSGSHAGCNIARVILDIIKDIGCLNKIGMLTLDNASNNDTMMGSVAQELNDLNIPFDVVGNRIRCFPHIINIAVKTALKFMTKIDERDPELAQTETDLVFANTWAAPPMVSSGPTANSEAPPEDEYDEALQRDVVVLARRIINSIRSSGQRREALQKIIGEGNKAGWPEQEKDYQVKQLQLLRDVDTRWSSTFLMIDRFIELYLAVLELLKRDPDIATPLETTELQVLVDIRLFLSYAHFVQEIVSAQKTPTLSVVLPLYEQLIVIFEALKAELPRLEHAIEAAIIKLKEYLKKSRGNKIYALAIVLNPTVGFKWLEKHWTVSEYQQARDHVETTMLLFQREHRERSRPSVSATPGLQRSVSAPSVGHSARSLGLGLTRIATLQPSMSLDSVSENPPSPSTPLLVPPSAVEQEARTLEDDKHVVAAEIRKYEEQPSVYNGDPEELKNFDIFKYWCDHRDQFPLLFRIALDVLPAQASAVPSERVFSSSKETDALRRSLLGSTMIEVLQILKYIYRNERVSFTDGLLATEIECNVPDVDPTTIDYLLAHREISKLFDLLDIPHSNCHTSDDNDFFAS